MLDIIKSIILGIVEGITEWLPVSSTGHLILFQTFLPFSKDISPNFAEMFNYVIQLGAIIAVVVLFFNKLWPFKMPYKNSKILAVDTGIVKKEQWVLWFKVLLATIPSALCFFIDDKIDSLMYSKTGAPNKSGVIVISLALVIYGILFIVVERLNKNRSFKTNNTAELTYKTALLIGAFQMLAVIPGTSRSGATILGALIIGVARPAAAEFSFFLAIPTMLGVSALKIVSFLSETTFNPNEFIVLVIGMVVSFLISLLCIKQLMSYVRKHDFALFGYYRIILGIIVFVIFTFIV